MNVEKIKKMIEEEIWSLFVTNQDNEISADEVSKKDLLYQSAYNDALIDVRNGLFERLDSVVGGY